MLGKGYRKDRVELDVNTKRDPPQKYHLHAQTNFKMHVNTFIHFKITQKIPSQNCSQCLVFQQLIENLLQNSDLSFPQTRNLGEV